MGGLAPSRCPWLIEAPSGGGYRGRVAASKISYRTATLERALPVPRDLAWDALTAAADHRSGVGLGDPPVRATEIVLSDEPPWRRVVQLDGAPHSPLCQTSFSLRDDGDACLVAWSCLVDPTGVEATALDDLVDAITADGAAQLDALAETVGAAD